VSARARRRAARAAGTALLLAVACGDAGEAPAPGPPASLHGAIVIEPPMLRVGDLVTVDLAVVTPPDHRVRPVELTETIPPLWLLDAERLPVRRAGGRWTHVTRVRARVREAPGEYAWPAQTLEVETPDGEVRTVALEARPFIVTSVSDALPDRLEPFGLRAPGATARGGGLGHVLLGSALTLLALAGLVGARRLRARRRARADQPRDAATPAWVSADAELEAALGRIEADPRAAADAAALALRRYVHRRANRPVETLTTEEIAAQRPPGRLRSRWPEWLALLRRLDALRFPGGLDRAEGREALREALEDARRFVADSVPPRELR
jgi:hypothetical protein